MVTQELGRYQYRERPYTGMSTEDPKMLSPSLNPAHHLESDGNMSALASTPSLLMPMQQFENINSNPLVPVHWPAASLSGALHVQHNGSVTAIETPWKVDSSDIASTSSQPDRGAAAGLDIQSLVQEVAAVLRSSQLRLASTSGHRDNNDNMTTESPPPHYTVTGGQHNW